MKQGIEAILTPSHANALEPLNNQPLTSTFDHATADGESHSFKLMVFDVLVMRVEIIDEIGQYISRSIAEQWVFDGVFNIHSHLHCWPVSELMSGSKKPAASLLGSPVQPNGHCFE